MNWTRTDELATWVTMCVSAPNARNEQWSRSLFLCHSHSFWVRSRSTFNIIKFTYLDFIRFIFFIFFVAFLDERMLICLVDCLLACVPYKLACMWPVSVLYWVRIHLIWPKAVVVGIQEFDANALYIFLLRLFCAWISFRFILQLHRFSLFVLNKF